MTAKKSKTPKTQVPNERSVLCEVASLFSAPLDLEDTLKKTVDMVARLTGADACFLYLLEADRQELVLSASKTPHPAEVGRLKLKIGEGITGWVAAHLRPVAIARAAYKDPRSVGALPEDRFEAFLSIPILIKQDVVGVINAQHKKARTHPEHLISVLAMVGRQLGGLIETTRLYEETQRRARTIEVLSAVSTTLAQDRYPDDIMQLIVNMTAQMIGAHICSIMLLDEKKQLLRIVAAQSLDPAYKDKPPIAVHNSLIGQVVITKKPLFIQDVRKEPSYQHRDLAVRGGMVSLLSVPMMYKGKVSGALNMYKPSQGAFSKEELSFAQSVANQCAAAIENTRLLSEKLAAQEALEARKAIEKAKGLLMEAKHISEAEAFREIQRQSMDLRRSMREISEAIVLAHGMIERRP